MPQVGGCEVAGPCGRSGPTSCLDRGAPLGATGWWRRGEAGQPAFHLGHNVSVGPPAGLLVAPVGIAGSSRVREGRPSLGGQVWVQRVTWRSARGARAVGPRPGSSGMCPLGDLFSGFLPAPIGAICRPWRPCFRLPAAGKRPGSAGSPSWMERLPPALEEGTTGGEATPPEGGVLDPGGLLLLDFIGLSTGLTRGEHSRSADPTTARFPNPATEECMVAQAQQTLR